MTTGRINQITILKHCYSSESPKRNPCEWQSKVVRFNKFCMILAASIVAKAPYSLKD
jgi:hypothetical protein